MALFSAAAAALAALLLIAAASVARDPALAKSKSHAAKTPSARSPAAAKEPAADGQASSTSTTPKTTAASAEPVARQASSGGGKPGGGKPNGNKGGKKGEDEEPTGGGTTTPTPTTTPTTSTTTTPVASSTATTTPAVQAPGSSPTRRTARTRRSGSGASRPSRAATGGRRARAVLGVSGRLVPPVDLAAPPPAGGRPAKRPRRSESSSEASQDDGSAGATVTRTVRDIVEVVPTAVKRVLIALAALSAMLGVGYLLMAARARRLARQRADLLQEVGLLQTALLPPVPANVGAMRTSVAYQPSSGPGAGGDFYDALTLPGGRAAFLLGDVSGHGRQALARTAFIRYTLRAYIEAGLEPRLALQLAGPVIDEHLDGDFATVVLAIHDPRNGSLTYACAGHPAPIVVGPTRPEPIVVASSPPIGLGMRTGVRQTTVPLPPGSVVCLYTDGLAEARTRTGILGRPRLTDILEELGREATAPELLDRVAAEARLLTDDMATVVLSPTAGVTAGGFRAERLEVDLEEARSGLARRFLEACGVGPPRLSGAVDEATAWADSHGAAVIHVCFGVRGPVVEVIPRDAESLEAASRRRALV